MTLYAHDLAETPYPQGLVGFWGGTYLTVPSGWEIANGAASVNDPTYTRPSLLGDRYFKAPASTATVPGATGGASTHTHTLPAHNHGGTSGGSSDNSAQGYPNAGSFIGNHTHSVTSSSQVSYSAENNAPLHVGLIPIVYTMKAGGTGKGLPTLSDLEAGALPPQKIMALWMSATPPTGWNHSDGGTYNSVVTKDCKDRFIVGVATTGTAPGTQVAGGAHTHTDNHTHTSGGPSASGSAGNQALGLATSGHTHTLSAANVATGSGDLTPLYTETAIITRTDTTSAAALLTAADLDASLRAPRGLILVWMDSVTPPSGWAHCDGAAWSNGTPSGYSAARPSLLGRMGKSVTNATTNGGTAGGFSTHSHIGGSHSHSLSSAAGGTGSDPVTSNPASTHSHSASDGGSAGSGTLLPKHITGAWIVCD